MKNAPTRLIYHSLHKRPMSGCLPLFLLLATLATIGAISLVHVTMPPPFHSRGQGTVGYKNDELTRFQVRQRSALPLRLPTYADPAAQQPVAHAELTLGREVPLQEAPPLPITAEPPDSAVLDAAELLRLPPTEETEVEP